MSPFSCSPVSSPSRAPSRAECKRWGTALEQARSAALSSLASYSEDEADSEVGAGDPSEVQQVVAAMSAKLEELNTCCSLIGEEEGISNALKLLFVNASWDNVIAV